MKMFAKTGPSGEPIATPSIWFFITHFEEKWVMKNINQPTVWFRHVDDTFTLFRNKNDALSFLHYLNGRLICFKKTPPSHGPIKIDGVQFEGISKGYDQ